MGIVLIILILSILILLVGMNIHIFNIKQIKNLAYDNDLLKIINKLPDNLQVCKSMLKMINNKNVKIEENNDKKSKDSMYLVMQNKIVVANISDTFTRIQTIAHECIHSIQNKHILKFNFIYSNIYIIIWILLIPFIILNLWNFYEMKWIILIFFILLSCIYYIIRSYLEMDAMVRAKYLAKDYMINSKILSNEEINVVIDKYSEVNNIGIRLYNFMIAFNCIFKIIILNVLMLICL